MNYQVLFPRGVKKALTFSYDDGQIHDRRLVELFNRYQVKATFHLNAGTLGICTDSSAFVGKDEVKSLYHGHEVSCHGYHHPYFNQLPHDQMVRQIYEDKRTLEECCGYPVRGMSYPYGEYSEELIQTALSLGMEYSRTVESTNGFHIPKDFMRWNPSCHHSNVFDIMKEVIDHPHYRQLMLFYVWGHSYEFDRDKNWDLMEEFLQQISGQEDIWYASNIEIVDYIHAFRNLRVSVNEDCLYNPSAKTVWIKAGEQLLTIAAGETIRL